jgi:hypothetical protein
MNIGVHDGEMGWINLLERCYQKHRVCRIKLNLYHIYGTIAEIYRIFISRTTYRVFDNINGNIVSHKYLKKGVTKLENS